MSHCDDLALWADARGLGDAESLAHAVDCDDCAIRLARVYRLDRVFRTRSFWESYDAPARPPGRRFRELTSFARRLRLERERAERLVETLIDRPERFTDATATGGLVLVLLDVASEWMVRDPLAALRLATVATEICEALSADYPERFRADLLARSRAAARADLPISVRRVSNDVRDSTHERVPVLASVKSESDLPKAEATPDSARSPRHDTDIAAARRANPPDCDDVRADTEPAVRYPPAPPVGISMTSSTTTIH